MNKGFFIAFGLCVCMIICVNCKNRTTNPVTESNTLAGSPTAQIPYEDFKQLIKVKRLAYKKMKAQAGVNKQVIKTALLTFG